MDKKIKQLIARIKSHIIKLNGEKIKEVIRYGFYARSKSTKDSEMPIADEKRMGILEPGQIAR